MGWEARSVDGEDGLGRHGARSAATLRRTLTPAGLQDPGGGQARHFGVIDDRHSFGTRRITPQAANAVA
jgi:hypothetical protein